MKTLLILVGKTTDKHLSALQNDYVERIKHYTPFDIITVSEIKNTKHLSEEQQKQQEGELILQQIQDGDDVILMDERGKEMCSIDFATWLQGKRNAGRRVVIIIGGPYGFSSDIYARSNDKISLSKMTFSHQMVRVIFTEQYYRACTILKGEKYHHE
jgi:23S rRNA (pseudouridine1915-N3)-methyltransferase